MRTDNILAVILQCIGIVWIIAGFHFVLRDIEDKIDKIYKILDKKKDGANTITQD